MCTFANVVIIMDEPLKFPFPRGDCLFYLKTWQQEGVLEKKIVFYKELKNFEVLSIFDVLGLLTL